MQRSDALTVASIPPATSVLVVDAQQIHSFVDAVFPHADPDTFVSLRSFADVGNAAPRIKSVFINDWETSTQAAFSPSPEAVKLVERTILKAESTIDVL